MMAQALPEEVSSSLAGLQLADNEPRTAPAPASAAAAAESEQPEQPPEQPPDSSAQSQMVPAKFLMSNSAAGACIGKGGETITKIQARCLNALLPLSAADICLASCLTCCQPGSAKCCCCQQPC